MSLFWSDVEPRFERINKRLENLEQCLVAVASKLGVPFTPPSSELPADVVELARSGDRLGAIKRYRELTGADVKEARAKIDEV